MIELSRYAFDSVRTDPEFILYRAHRSSFAKASSFAEASEDKSEVERESESDCWTKVSPLHSASLLTDLAAAFCAALRSV
jgi:hypothetical protein